MQRQANTLIERFGFMDPDRKTSKHDEIQMWVYENFKVLLQIAYPNEDVSSCLDPRLKLEYPIVEHSHNGTSRPVGFVDVFSAQYYIAVEVKASIPSVGDLIRQIQFYRMYLSGPRWFVVSPDDRAADILKAEGIYFLKYDRGGTSRQLSLLV